MRISWIVYGFTERLGAWTATSPVASIRYRVLSPIEHLQAAGLQHRVLTITPETDPPPWDKALQADVLVFSKSFTESNAELARRARAQAIPVLFDVCDDHYDNPRLGAHYREMSALADRVVCNTPQMARAAAPHCARPPVVIEDPYEGPRGAPRFAPGERLSLLWFGSPLNLGGLQAALGQVADYAERRPVSVTILTELNPALEAECARATAALAPRFTMSPAPWSLEGQWAALAACDAVLIPVPPGGGAEAKSANRMVEALWAGRPVVAQPLPAYAPFAEWTPVGPSILEGLARLEDDPGGIPDRIALAQAYIAAEHSPQRLATAWERVLRETWAEATGAP